MADVEIVDRRGQGESEQADHALGDGAIGFAGAEVCFEAISDTLVKANAAVAKTAATKRALIRRFTI